MKIFADFTEDCLRDVKPFSLENELMNIIAKIEKQQTAKFLEKYKSPAMVKRAGKYRFIAYEKIFGDIIFIVFLRVLLKGKEEYKNFCNDSELYSHKYLPNDSWFQIKIAKKNNSDIKEKPELSEIEEKYLFQSVKDNSSLSLMVYESNKWIASIRKSDYKSQYGEIIREILEDPKKNSECIANHSTYKIQVVYKYIDTENILYLYDATNEFEKVKLHEKILEELEQIGLNKETVLKNSYRSYPEYVLYDPDVWLEIQNETEGNLALSIEEAKILNSIIHHDYSEPLFPLFVNGRAGSGKSTLLYYIFSHILLNHIIQSEKLSNPPLFLTYSSRLIDIAKRSVKKILNHNALIRTSLTEEQKKEVDSYIRTDQLFEKSFKGFRKFQVTLLGKEDKYTESSHYRFSNFKEDWAQYSKRNPSKSVRSITPEFAWYVIRTFIKGMQDSEATELDTEDYLNLSKEQQTVTPSTYKLIFEVVYKNWYKQHLSENGYWDDQDLTKDLLNNIDSIKLDYPAIVCDEAQDFSSIEIELISRLPVFSNRTIPPRNIKFIPIAFAGDPLQTINPTGFKWESIKSVFYEKLQGDYGKDNKIILNYRELNNNYRSVKNIVIFNNIIQLIRGVLFNLKDIRPQYSWFSDNIDASPCLLIDDFTVVENALVEDAKTKTIIIPCEEDQEKEFIQNQDSFLQEKALVNNEVLQNIWSPMNVKGLEYKTVIVYKFGEFLSRNLGLSLTKIIDDLIKSNIYNNDFIEESKKIELEYFLNKLYVATSRARKNLIIVDTKEGENALWSIFYSYLKELPIQYSFINDSINYDEDNEISDFQFVSEVVDFIDDNPEDLAKQYFNDGRDSMNARKLKTAGRYFLQSNKTTEANKAFALAAEYEKNYERAADYYYQINDWDKVAQCYWKSEEKTRYQKITSKLGTMKVNDNNLFLLASRYMENANRPNGSILFLTELYQKITTTENLSFYMIYDSSWEIIYRTLLEDLLVYYKSNPSLTDWDRVIPMMNLLYDKGLLIFKNDNYIKLLFGLQMYQNVIDILRSRGEQETELFLRSSAKMNEYPKKLEFLDKLKEYNKIWEEYNVNKLKKENMQKNHVDIILKALIEIKKTDEIQEFLQTHRDNISDIVNEKIFEKIIIQSYQNQDYMLGRLLVLSMEQIDDKQFMDLIDQIKNKSDDKKWLTFLVGLFVIHRIKLNHLSAVYDVLEKKHSLFINMIEKINFATIEKIMICELARKPNNILGSLEERKKIQSYVFKYLSNSFDWLNIITCQEAGAAIEKLAYHIYARDFYEIMFKGSPDFIDDEIKEFAKKRWLKVKQKQAEGNIEEQAKKQIDSDIRKFYKSWGFEHLFELDEIEDYPLVDNDYSITLEESYENDILLNEQSYKAIVNNVNIDTKISILINQKEEFTIKTIYNKQKVKFNYLLEDETVYYDANSQTFSSQEININIENNHGGEIICKIPEWSLTLKATIANHTHKIDISYMDIENCTVFITTIG